MATISQLKDIAALVRRDILSMTTHTDKGFPASSLSSVEILTSLIFSQLKLDVKNPENLNNDILILSKGQAAPALYSCFSRAGLTKEDILSYFQPDSALTLFPDFNLPWINYSSISRGNGLGIGIGNSFAQNKRKNNAKTFVVIGDQESLQGLTLEAAQLAIKLKLSGICAIIDKNSHSIDSKEIKKLWESMGWHVSITNGHDFKQLSDSYKHLDKSSKPILIIAETIKGKDCNLFEQFPDRKDLPLNDHELSQVLSQMPKPKMPSIKLGKPKSSNIKETKLKVQNPEIYGVTSLVSTDEAFLNSLLKQNKIESDIFLQISPNNRKLEKIKESLQNSIIESQDCRNLANVSIGLSMQNYIPILSIDSSSLSKVHDQIKIASRAKKTIICNGYNSGLSSGIKNLHGIEDLSLTRTLPSTYIFVPSDANAAEKLTAQALNHQGLTYIRTSSLQVPSIYSNSDEFHPGEFKIVNESKESKIVIAASGSTVHEALKASQDLKKNKIQVSVLDCYSIKPFISSPFIEYIKTHGNKLLIVEDNIKPGSLGEMIISELKNTEIKIEHLSILHTPESANKEILYSNHKIDSNSIVNACIEMTKPPVIPLVAQVKETKSKKKKRN